MQIKSLLGRLRVAIFSRIQKNRTVIRIKKASESLKETNDNHIPVELKGNYYSKMQSSKQRNICLKKITVNSPSRYTIKIVSQCYETRNTSGSTSLGFG
jgi:hypothetical protein